MKNSNLGDSFVDGEAREPESSMMGRTTSSMAPRRRDFDALISWLSTFPRMEGDCSYYGDMDAILKNEAFATDVLCIGEEIFDEFVAIDCARKDVDSKWNTLCYLLSSKLQQVLPETKHESMSSVNCRILLLSAMLRYGVSDKCRQQRTYVSRIMSLSTEDQKVLMELIGTGKGSKCHQLTPPRGPRNRDDCTIEKGDTKSTRLKLAVSPPEEIFSSSQEETSLSPDENLFFPSATGLDELFSSPAVDPYIDKIITELREENENLKQELERSHLLESDLGQQLERSVEKFRKEMMKVDSASMRHIDDVRDDYEQVISILKQEVSTLRSTNDELVQRQLDSQLVSRDVLERVEERLAETQEKLGMCNKRIEELSSVKKALLLEEEAHSASVEACHRLENELKSVKPLKHKPEKYKSRLMETERQLTEREQNLKEAFKVRQETEQKHELLSEEVSYLKKEADDLRCQLAERGLMDTKLCTSHPDEDGSSMQVARLRRENMELRDYLAEVEQQNQYELDTSQEYVVGLQAQVEEMTNTAKALQAEFDERTSQLMDSQASLSKTCNQLRETETKFETLRVDAAKWKQRADDAKIFTVRRQQLLNKLQDGMTKAMDDDKETIKTLEQEVKEWMKAAKETEKAMEKCQKEHSQTMQKYACSLDHALLREEALQCQNAELMRSMKDLQDDLDEERRMNAEARLILSDNDEREMGKTGNVKDKSNRLMGLLAEEREVHQTQFDLLKTKYQQHLLEVKEQAAETEARMEDEHSRHIATLINTLMEDIQMAESRELIQADRDGQRLQEAYEAAVHGHAVEKGVLEGIIDSYKDQLSSISTQVHSLSEENTSLKEALENRLSEPVRQEISKDSEIVTVVSQRHGDWSQLNKSLMDTIKEMKGEIVDLQNDNDELHKRLKEKLRAFKTVQDQFETLQSEYDSLLRESKVLKRDNAKISSFQNCVVYALTGSTEVFSPSYTQSGFTGTSPARLRKEYELKMMSMIDEKRKLVIRSNSVVNDMQKAMQYAWEADQQVATLKKELRAAKLARRELQLALESKEIHFNHEISTSLEDSNNSSSTGDDGSSVEFIIDSSARKPALDVSLMINQGSNDIIEALPLGSLSMDSIPPPPAAMNDDRSNSELSFAIEAVRLENSQDDQKQQTTILSPSSKHNGRVHWNDENGSMLASPIIKDRYAAAITSPASEQGTPLAMKSPRRWN